MEKFYNDVITFLGTMDPFVKVLIIGMLAMLIFLSAKLVVKTHVNPKKPVLKFGQFFILAILVALEIFICINVF